MLYQVSITNFETGMKIRTICIWKVFALLVLTCALLSIIFMSSAYAFVNRRKVEKCSDSNWNKTIQREQRVRNESRLSTYHSEVNSKADPPLKKILFWNDAYRTFDYGFGHGRQPFVNAGCKIDTCMTTSDRMMLPFEDWDAVMWHSRSGDQSFPWTRNPKTRYIFWVREAAQYPGNIRLLKASRYFFNWTYTYRLDSDFFNPYGVVVKRETLLDIPKDRDIAKTKTKLAAWFVSNCKAENGRHEVVAKLQKYMQIDVYGKCGPLQCRGPMCNVMLDKEYKFYLSFENSLCSDYITEKFFSMLKLNIVPVVYGLGNYKRIAPPHSYIDALSFATVEELAQYLLFLDKHDDAYNEYFEWKPYYTLMNLRNHTAKVFCDICERLHTDQTTKSYDIYDWFIAKSKCITVNSLRIKQFIGA